MKLKELKAEVDELVASGSGDVEVTSFADIRRGMRGCIGLTAADMLLWPPASKRILVIGRRGKGDEALMDAMLQRL